jgi:hypothetical protein
MGTRLSFTHSLLKACVTDAIFSGCTKGEFIPLLVSNHTPPFLPTSRPLARFEIPVKGANSIIEKAETTLALVLPLTGIS